MRTLTSTILAVLFVAVLFAGCDSFVEDVDLPIDTIDNDQLTDESQVPFLIAGLQTRFATTHDRLALLSDGLSDQFIFDQRVPNATFPTYQEVDIGEITLDNNSVDNPFTGLGELRFFSDNFLERIGELEFEDADLQRESQFSGNFYGGVARYFYATFFGLDPRNGGGVIDSGPFIPSEQMYSQALVKLNAALGFADAYQTQVVNTLIARIHLYQGDFGAARAAALNGLQEGDAPFQSLHSVESQNRYYQQAGIGRTQWVADFRYKEIVDADPAEAVRVLIEVIEGNDGDPDAGIEPTIFYRQAKYPENSSPIDFASWEENTLILAELDLRDGNAAVAVAHVNAVRASHGLDPLASLDMDTLIFEREKEFFAEGFRLVDQRRFDLWHLGEETWQYLPITQSERNNNDNF